MAATQFEPIDARRCFPCWDEPAIKAIFKITLDVPSELLALSNMPAIEEKSDGDLKTVSFQESPIMSTYLVAVVVGLFDYVENYTADGIKVRVYCPVGRANEGKFALDVAVRTLDLYREYFAIPYALPKLDLVAIPDFSGAMENYGLVTFVEADILYNKQHAAAGREQKVASVVAHELGHQWFGNLVTMEWWTHVWLNEGFATWLSGLAVDSLFPEWKSSTDFVGSIARALTSDALAGSHPIELEINQTTDIEETFDLITYDKGAAVLRMLQSYLGLEILQRSLTSYLRKYAWSNAKTEDLWAVLEEVSGQPVSHVMSSWTKQKGFPLISVEVNNQKLKLEQTQFLSSGVHGNGRWVVPITLCCGSYDACHSFLLEGKSATIDLKRFSGCSLAKDSNVLSRKNESNKEDKFYPWIKVNADQSGFYRVKYDESLGAVLRYASEENYLSATDRFGILDDSYALSMAQQLPLTSLLTLMNTYRKEQDSTVLTKMISISNRVTRIEADATPELLSCVKEFFISLLQKSAEKLGWDPRKGESQLDAILRGTILTSLAVFGDNTTRSEATRRFHSFLKDRNTSLFSPLIRKAAYVALMQHVTTSDRSDYESLLKIFNENSEEKIAILSSLASCPDPRIVGEVLNFLLSSEVSKLDRVFGLDVSWEGRETAWIWLRDKWDDILKTWGFGAIMGRVVSNVVSPFASSAKIREVEEFFVNRTIPSIASSLNQSLEQVVINAKWVQSIQSEKHLARTVKKLTHGTC